MTQSKKREALVELITTDASCSQIGRKYRIPKSTLGNWHKQYQSCGDVHKVIPNSPNKGGRPKTNRSKKETSKGSSKQNEDAKLIKLFHQAVSMIVGFWSGKWEAVSESAKRRAIRDVVIAGAKIPGLLKMVSEELEKINS